MTLSPLPQLCRLARTLILWPIDTAATALYDLGLKTIENLLNTTEAFDNLATATRNNITSYTADDYQRAAEVIKRTEPLRAEPWPDYAIDDNNDRRAAKQFAKGQPIRRSYPDGSSDVMNQAGFIHYDPDGNPVAQFGE